MCGESYRLHYIERLRSPTTTSALVFGTAIDNALNLMLEGKEGYEKEFIDRLTTAEINGVKTYIPTCSNVHYIKADFVPEILTENDIEDIKEQASFFGLQAEPFLQNRENIETESSDHAKVASFIKWTSLKRKGLMMLEAYKLTLLPLIGKVISTQSNINLENENGDSIIGLIDILVEIPGVGLVIVDNKTSGRPYEEDSVQKSEQLALYKFATPNVTKCAYAVMIKDVNLNKKRICEICGNNNHSLAKTCNAQIGGARCNGYINETINPTIDTQFIIGDIDESFQQKVLSEIEEVNFKISQNIFDKNEKQCYNWFGRKCVYFDLCKNKTEAGLVRVTKEVR